MKPENSTPENSAGYVMEQRDPLRKKILDAVARLLQSKEFNKQGIIKYLEEKGIAPQVSESIFHGNTEELEGSTYVKEEILRLLLGLEKSKQPLTSGPIRPPLAKKPEGK